MKVKYEFSFGHEGNALQVSSGFYGEVLGS